MLSAIVILAVRRKYNWSRTDGIVVDDSVQGVPYFESHSSKANILMQPSSTLEFGGFIADVDSLNVDEV